MFNVINLHFTDKCNYNCKHCFVKKRGLELSLCKIKEIVDKIERYFIQNNIKGRINLAGGEPMICLHIQEVIDYISSKNILVSIITNGSLLTSDFIFKNKEKISGIGISVDSLHQKTNKKIGRYNKDYSLTNEKLIEICRCVKKNHIKLKINICVSKMNYLKIFLIF